MKKKIISCVLSCFLLVFSCVLAIQNTNLKLVNDDANEKVRTVTEQNLDWSSCYNTLKENYEDIEVGFDEQEKSFEVKATQVFTRADFEAIDNLSINSDFEEVSITYDMKYIPEENVMKLVCVTDGEVTDELIGSPFYDESGKLDAVFNCDGEPVYLSDLQEAGMINNCGWFSRLFKKIAKVVVAAVAVAVVVAAVVVAAPAVAAAVTTVATTTVTVGVGGAAALAGTGAVLGAAATAAAGAAAAAAGAALVAGATAAAITAGVGLAKIVVDEITGTMTLNDVYTIGQEKVDILNKSLILALAGTTFVELNKVGKMYHIAFAVSQSFSEGGTNYAVGDLYINKTALSFAEAYAVLIGAGLVNTITNLTKNSEIIAAVKAIVLGGDLSTLVETIKGYQNKGYFGKQAMGIYADSVEAATKLAIVTGAWIKNADYALGGVGGYYHFHDLLKLIHIWYGNKIKN